jgi:hypothetical protein
VSACLAMAGAAVAPAPHLTSAAPALGFSTPTVVDPFRQGFEPDISVDPTTGALYSSVPNGTPGTSVLWRSDDGGHDWRVVEGNLQGEPSVCPPVAGGDTELAVDPHDGSLYYADLQPLTNFNMSVSHDKGKTWLCNPISVPDSGVDRQWFAIDSNAGANSVSTGGIMYFDYDDTTQSPSPAGGNVLVVNATENGLQFGSTCTPNVGGVGSCAGPSVRVTLNEGLPGNLAVDDNAGSPHQHSVYALHSSADLGAVILSRCDGGGATDAISVANYCLDPTAAQPPFALSSHWSDHTVFNTDVNNAQTHIVANNFCTLAIDSAGNLYALWSQYPGTTDSSNPVSPVYKYTGTGQLLLSHSTDGGTTWSAPQQINPPSQPNVTQPWLTAGDAGRVAVAWYGAPQDKAADGTFGPDALLNGVWNVYVAENLDTLGGGAWNIVKVSDHPAKLGGVSTEGLVLPTGPDRSLGDFMKISHDASGALVLVYVDDNTSLNPGFQNSGPVVFSRQIAGTGLLAGKVIAQAATPSGLGVYNTGSVTDPVGDAVVHVGGQDLTAPPHLDITASSLSMADATHLKVTLTVNDPNLQQNLGPDPTLGGATADAWIVRWDFDPAAEPAGTTPGGFFVAMENSTTGGQKFFDGAILTTPSPVTPTLFSYAYPSDHAVQGSVTGDTITWTVPVADVGSPKLGDQLFQIQAFTATEAFPSQGSATDPIGIINVGGSEIAPNLADQSPSYSSGVLALTSNNGNGGNGNGGNGNGGNGNGGNGSGNGGLPNSASATAATPAAGAAALVVLVVAGMIGLAVRRRHHRP